MTGMTGCRAPYKQQNGGIKTSKCWFKKKKIFVLIKKKIFINIKNNICEG